MTDLRKAAQMALDWRDKNGELLFALGGWDFIFEINNWSQSLRGALAQPEPEPVAWWDGVGRFATAKEKDWDRRTGGILSAGRDIPLYTAPPQREWKNLLEEDIDEVVNQTKGFGMNSHTFARAIETKLKERNANE